MTMTMAAGGAWPRGSNSKNSNVSLHAEKACTRTGTSRTKLENGKPKVLRSKFGNHRLDKSRFEKLQGKEKAGR